MTRSTLLNGIRVLDGGFATELEYQGADISGPLWSAHVLEDAPEKIAAVHRAYILAGAEIIATASYQVSRQGYVEYGLTAAQADRALLRSVELARTAASEFPDRRVLVAASLGPYGAMLHNGSEYHGNYGCTFDELVRYHRERIEVLAAAPPSSAPDLLAFETLPSLEEARAVAAQDPERGRRLHDYANIVEKAAEYCHHLSENWRLASKQASEFTRIDLVQVLNEVRQVVFFGEIAVQFNGASTAMIRGSKFELMRVFQNVFKNSLEAGAKLLTVSIARNADRIDLTIADNGAGMDPDHVRRALKGGFSNKENGTGLGLSICRHLLGTHGATLALESAIGKGTTVKMSFPSAA